MNLLTYSLSIFSIFWLIKYSLIFSSFRDWIASLGWDKVNFAINCSFCFSFWATWALWCFGAVPINYLIATPSAVLFLDLLFVRLGGSDQSH